MSGRIPQSFIDELLSRVDIVEVIEEHLPLRKVGRSYQALCPFHTERTPSFSVNREKQFYHCFGCGATGSAIRFTMDFLRLDFVETVSRLSERAGIEVPTVGESSARASHAGLYDLLERVARFYALQLRDHAIGARPIGYLKERGLDGRTAAHYGLGYAPPGWDHLLRAFGGSAEDRQTLQLAGLLIQKEDGKCYDRFRDRIIFPIRDPRGRVVGFGGRALDSSEPKYLNSPETPVFRKGSELYGLFEALRGPAKPERLLVVEGYMDALALAQFGVSHVAATLGTALTREHLGRLFRGVQKVVFCFDGDEAGNRAAWRALELSLPLLKDGRSVGFLFLPAGEDPDSWVRKAGTMPFVDPQKITPLSDFMLDFLTRGADLRTIEGRAALVEQARPLLGAVAPGALQGLLTRRISELSGLSVDQLSSLIHASPARPARRSATPPSTRPRVTNLSATSIIEMAIRFLLHHPGLAGHVPNTSELAYLRDPRAGLLMSILEYAQQRPDLRCGAMLERWSGTNEGDWLCQVAAQDILVSDVELEAEFLGAMDRIRGHAEKHRRKELARTTAHSPAALEPSELRESLRYKRRSERQEGTAAGGS